MAKCLFSLIDLFDISLVADGHVGRKSFVSVIVSLSLAEAADKSGQTSKDRFSQNIICCYKHQNNYLKSHNSIVYKKNIMSKNKELF